VRKAFLCGEENSHREDWIEVRLRELVDIFAIDCAGFAIMDNHLHLLLRLDSQRAQNWSNEEVAGRWLTLFPVRDDAGKALPICQNLVTELAGNPAWVARVRGRLSNLGWFTKCLKESGAAPAPAPHPTAPGCRRAGCSDWSKLKPRPDKPCKGPEW